MRKIPALGAAALVALLGLSACQVKENNGGNTTTGGQKEISFLTFETPNLNAAYWDAAIKRVTDKNPDIKVNKLISPTQDRTAYAKQLLAAGKLPDVMIAVSPGGFAEAGELYPWTEDELKDFQFPKNSAVKGKVYQLPANTQTIPVVYYNKDQFTQAGITAPPATYAELLADAEKLKAKGLVPFTGGGVHDSIGPLFAGIWATEVYAKSPSWMHDRRDGKVKFSDADSKKAWSKLAELTAKGYIDKTSVSRDYAADQQAFLDGKGAIYPMGNWLAGALDDTKSKPKFQVGQFNWPGDADNKTVPAFTGGGLLVSAKAKNLDAAKKFALGFQLDKTNLDNSVKADGLFPAIRGYSPPSEVGAAFKDGYDLYAKGVSANTVVPAFNFEAGDDALIPGMGAKMYSSIVDIVTGKKTVDQVVAFLDAEWAKG